MKCVVATDVKGVTTCPIQRPTAAALHRGRAQLGCGLAQHRVPGEREAKLSAYCSGAIADGSRSADEPRLLAEVGP
jgi:hypothetical protein